MFLNPLPPRLPHFIQLSLDILNVGLDAGDVFFQAFEDLVGVSGVDIGEQDAMVPRCRATFYQDRIFDLDRLGQGRVKDSYLRFDFCKPSLQSITLIEFAQLGEFVSRSNNTGIATRTLSGLNGVCNEPLI